MADRMTLPPEEPRFEPWSVEPVERFVRRLEAMCPNTSTRPCILAVDGRSGSGKSTLATLIHKAVVSRAALVHTDDLPSSSNWSGKDTYTPRDLDPTQRSFFDWTERLLGEVLKPARAGQEVQYRPPAWDDWNREENAINVPPECALLILEGVGAARRELTHLLDVVVWVQGDLKRAKARGIERDGGDAEAAAFWEEFMSAEFPFLAEQRPWERADIIVNGTPEGEHDSLTHVVVAEPR